MRHKLLIALFAFGTIAGFTSGFHHLAHRCHGHREAVKRELASTCAEAARAATLAETRPAVTSPAAVEPAPTAAEQVPAVGQAPAEQVTGQAGTTATAPATNAQ